MSLNEELIGYKKSTTASYNVAYTLQTHFIIAKSFVLGCNTPERAYQTTK